MSDAYLLMTPGPVPIPEQVLNEFARPMIHHRTPEFEGLLKVSLENVKKVFQTEEHVYFHTSTGSGGMESAIVNTLSPGDKVLVVITGKFGERFSEIAKAFGLNVTLINITWGESVKAEQVQAAMNADQDIKAVFCQACETSTGVLNPIEEIAKLTRLSPHTLLIVDAISALGVVDLPMDKWGIDVMIAGSQKSFMLPAGLSMIAFSKKAWDFVEMSKLPKYYFDVKREKKANLAGQTFFSSPVSHIRGLAKALDLILKNGLANNINKFIALSRGLRVAGETLGLKSFAKVPSPSVTTFLTPAGIDSEKLRDHLESKYNLTVMGGQEKLKGKVIRVGTLGDVGREEVRETLLRIAKGLTDLGFKADGPAAVKKFDEVCS